MAFTTGTRIGPYKVAALIGKGGMGEVYRATDTNLGRDVAVKILPDAVADDPDRLMRFEREARTLASLNDPHIAHIYGFEKAGRTHALVMELVDGPTLADRIAQGPLPVDEALGIARQIAEALEAAHEQGIVHRDLKPANVKVRPDGAVKVLDFGLAKVLEPSSSTATDATASPTITSPATMPGVGLLGTAAYMSPEQARGRPVDKRSDIWAFGCVLYEMLTGRRAFGGDTTTEVIARILERDPDLTGLPPTTPAPVVRLLRRCLEKDARRRLRDIGEARFELEESKAGSNAAIASHPASSPASVAARPRRRLIVALCTLVLGAAVGTAAMWLSRRAPSSDQRPTSTFAITLPQDQKFTLPTRQMIALSPRGTHLAYVANSRLYLRALDQLSATPIQGTEGTTDVGALFFSPDGQWIGFWQGGELKKISLAGGAPIKICDSPLYAGASWGADDTIVFGRGGAGIWRVSGQGGTPERIIAVDEEKGYIAHGPQMLPGGRRVLFTLRRVTPDNIGGWNDAQIVVQSLDTNERNVIVDGGRDGRYVSTGHIVYARSGVLFAIPFDVATLEKKGGPVPVLEGVRDAGLVGDMTGATHFAVSGDGTLVYVPRDIQQDANRVLVWVSRAGVEQPLGAPARAYDYPQLSPDGQRVAVEIGPQIWLFDLKRDTMTRFTFEGVTNETPVWTPDGKRIVFTSTKDGPRNLYWQLADGSGGLERLTSSPQLHIPRSWTPDGQVLIFHESTPGSQRDISLLRLRDRKTEPFLATPFNEGGARLSPDGRWLAYISDETGRPEIFVQPYPRSGAKWQVSTEGGTEPMWNPRGRELFYRNGNQVMSSETTTGASFAAGKPRVLFRGEYRATEYPQLGTDYDVSADGQRFLMIKEATGTSSTEQVNVVLNWLDELKRRVPVH